MTIINAFCKCQYYMQTHHNICVSVSGGSDSDIMLDMVIKILKSTPEIDKSKVHFIFFDTGIEYCATKRHLEYLENRYDIKIKRLKAINPVPVGTKKYGLPFISKYISEMIDRLQCHGFDFANDGEKDYETLTQKYPKCKTAIKWWCNANGEKSNFNINRSLLLKEYMIKSPPSFKISSKCCQGAKKDNGKKYTKENDIDLNLIGIRKFEGGIRSSTYKTCFNKSDYGDYHRPLQWFTDADKLEYERLFNIKHSDCYGIYGLKRTGCAGCPFNSKFENELEIIKKHEPSLYKAINNIFGDSYTYMRNYRNFKKKRDGGQNENKIVL